MPHGTLTPLGKQLRSVILTIGSVWTRSARDTPSSRHVAARVHHDSIQRPLSRTYSTAAAAIATEAKQEEELPVEPQTAGPSQGNNFGNRRVAASYESPRQSSQTSQEQERLSVGRFAREPLVRSVYPCNDRETTQLPSHRVGWAPAVPPPALQVAEHQGTSASQQHVASSARQRAPKIWSWMKTICENGRSPYIYDAEASRRLRNKVEYSFISPKSRHVNAKYKRRTPHRLSAPSGLHGDTASLDDLLARYRRHIAEESTNVPIGRSNEFPLTAQHASLLRSYGCGIEDLAAWADIVRAEDPSEAVEKLMACARLCGGHTIPLAVFGSVLRRPYISPSSLRMLIAHAWGLRNQGRGNASPGSTGLLVIFIRLVRHARKVWPEALPNLALLLLKHFPNDVSRELGDETIRTMGVELNKAMRLLSLPTAMHPFKMVDAQETAILHILTYMANHSPFLHINREGYRAVIRLQLAQKKTKKEQQWAKLKALSWPPWKEDRTRMDADIGPEDGISRAGGTLQRMREAGYAAKPWDQIAGIYSGWDTDGTPTIQTRTLFASANAHVSESTGWSARIAATRTAQEAWACYEAFEQTGAKPNSDLVLAVLEKLYEEEKRHRLAQSKRIVHNVNHDQYPGDVKEVQPLPPSAHLETYTQTPAPNIESFFRHLRGRGIVLQGRCLAYIVKHATSRQRGFDYISVSDHSHHAGHSARHVSPANVLLHPRQDADYEVVPVPLLHAFIVLLCRYSNVALNGTLRARWSRLRIEELDNGSDPTLNPKHAIVHAIWILTRLSSVTHINSWNVVLWALSKEQCFRSIHLAFSLSKTSAFSCPPATGSAVKAILAWRLGRKVLDLLRRRHLHLDADGLLYVCYSTENAAIAAWQILRAEKSSNAMETAPGDSWRIPGGIKNDIKEILHPAKDQHVLQDQFNILIGRNVSDTTPAAGHTSEADLPVLLTVPNPALLHAYVRVLGWLAAYEALRHLVRFVVQHQGELRAQRDLDRNGQAVMRRVVVALRVFLERSWLEDDATAMQPVLPADAKSEEDAMLSHLVSSASDEQVADIRGMIESVNELGGWPSDEEVQEYCRNGQDKFARFRESR